MQTVRRIIAAALLFVLVTAAFAACGMSEPTDNARVQIVTTIFPQYDFARHIAGTRADCTMLLTVGTADSHAWEPTAGQFATIADADLFLCIGGESESWAEELISAASLPEQRVLRMLDLVEGVPVAHDHAHDEHDHAHALDEHVWTDPDNAILMTAAILEALCEIDPAGEETYRANAASYLAELSQLSAAYHDALDDAPARTLVVADKFPFRYLAHNYGLSYLSAFPGCASDTEPSLQMVYDLIKAAEQPGTAVVLYVAHGSRKIADVVSESSGKPLRAMYACNTITAAELAAGETYLSLMRHNLAVIQEALGLCS